jgi:DNA-binding transcriptional LysR family regulator
MADKKRTGLDWEDLRFFFALASHGSLSAAARALKVNHATVARRIASLEASTGYSLFERRADGYRLSDHGRSILAEARAMEASAAAIGDRLASPAGPSGRVRLTTIRSIADLVIAPNLQVMREAYPAVQLEILSDLRLLSLAQRDADIALRLGRPRDSDLTGRRMATIRYGFYCSEDRLAEWKAGKTIPLIGYDLDNDLVAEGNWLNQQFPDHPFAFRANSSITQANAALAGIGVVLLPRYVARHVPGLAEIDFGEPMPDRELWMLAPPSLVEVQRVRAVWKGLLDIFERRHHMFE